MNLAFDALGQCDGLSCKALRPSSCRLFYLIGGLGAGGSERQLYSLLRVMDRERYQPEVVVWSFHKDDTYVAPIQKLGVPLHCFPSYWSGFRKLLQLRRLVGRAKPEVIHSYNFYTNFAAWWAAVGTPSVAIGSMRSDFDYDRTASGVALGKLSLKWPSTQIYNSAAAAERARTNGGWFLPRRVFVARNGIDLEEFRETPLAMNGQVRILGIGSLVSAKRWDRLLMVAANLHEKGLEFSVEICGTGPLQASLTGQARTLGVLDRVRFLGQRNDIPKLLASATFLAHTADSEGCPNVVMESMACGRAVVATDAGEIPRLIDDGYTGFVVRRGDNEALTNVMTRLIADRTLCLRLGQAGRAKAEREFGVTRLVESTLAYYGAAAHE